MTTPTTNPVPSTAAQDLLYNAERLDEIVNSTGATYVDRLGQPRRTVAGAVAALSSVVVRNDWSVGVAYNAQDVVWANDRWWIALNAHTSGATFAGDQATYWRPYQAVGGPGGLIFPEEIITLAAGASVITITAFVYTPGTNSVRLFKEHGLLQRGIDYTETDGNTLTLAEAVTEETTFTVLGGLDVNPSSELDATEVAFTTATGEVTSVHQQLRDLSVGQPTVGFTGRDYISRGYRDVVLVNGAEVSISPARTSHHDMLRAWPSLVDPLTGSANFAVLNVAQQLVAIPGAVSAPYWTDPGPLVYNTAGSGAGFIPASIPGQIDFVTHSSGARCIQFTTPVGFGNGEAGKRRIQLNSYQVTTRIPVAWDLSFLIPDEDNAPYDAATGYDYPVLIWQLKDATSQPVWSVGYETTADPDVFDLYVNFLYSDYDLDESTYRRQYNAVSGTVGNSKSAIRVALAQVNRNEWNDLWIEMFLDERDHTDIAGGLGYATIRLNGASILEWSGPTYMKLNISGGVPVAHRWSLGLYRFEFSVGTTPQGVPTALKELDLNRAVDPAPYVRRMLFRRARMLKL